MRRAVPAFIASVLVVAAASAGAQRPAGPVRDNPARVQQQPQQGASGITGRVVDLASGRALPKAKVTLTSDSGTDTPPAFTDGNGAFAFPSLLPGRYTLFVEKTGYARLRYGARTELDPPVEVDVAAGMPAANVLVQMMKGGAIYGRITDDFGDPIVGAQVTLSAVQIVGSSPRLVPLARPPGETNDLGDYRIGDLPPGRYYVSVGGASLGSLPSGVPREWERLIAWARTFYPGATSSSAAQPVIIGAGDERGGVDFSVRPFDRISMAFSVSGIVTTGRAGTGEPSGRGGFRGGVRGDFVTPVQISLVPVDENGLTGNARTMTLASSTSSATVAGMGFDEGDWIVLARQGANGAIRRVHMAGGDDSTLALELRPGSRVSGRVVFDGDRAAPAPSTVSVSVHGAGDFAALPPGLLANRPTAPRADGTFDIGNLFGTISIDAVSPAGWTLKAVLLGGRDLLDDPLPLRTGENVAGVQVVFSDQVASISGTTSFPDGTAAPGCTIALFPDAPVARFNARRMRLIRSDRAGAFRFRDVPTGAYRLAAMVDMDPVTWLSEESIGALRSRAQPIVLAGRAHESLALTCQVSR